jgi:hypothetical protein
MDTGFKRMFVSSGKKKWSIVRKQGRKWRNEGYRVVGREFLAGKEWIGPIGEGQQKEKKYWGERGSNSRPQDHSL